MDSRRAISFAKISLLSFLFFLFSVLFLKGFPLDSITNLNTDEIARKNIFNIALILCAWLFIPLLATVIISLLAFRISPDEESVEAEGENIIKVLPGLKFRAKGASATFIILIALSSLVVLTQINSFIIPSKTDQYADKLSAVLYKHGLLDKSNKIDDIDAAISYIDNYLEKAVKGLDTWRLSTKLGIYDPKSGGSTLMSDAEVQKIMRNKDALKVKVESVPKIGPFGTNVWIDKLLYFPTEIKNIDDVRKNIEESQDDINIEFEVQRPGDNNIYRQSVNLNKMSLANEIEFRESKEKVSESKPKSCDMNQDGLTLSINLDDHRMWIGPCIFLDYRGG